MDVPGSRVRSDECRAKQSKAAKVRWSKPEEREAQSERLKVSAPWTGQTLSAEHRAAISEGGAGVSHDVSQENREKMAVRGRLLLEDIKQRPGYIEKLSVAQVRRAAADPNHGFKNPDTWAKGFETRIKNGPSPGAGRGICGFRKGQEHYTRSTLEANFARILLFEGIPYQYEPRCFKLEGRGYYTPDFYLEQPLVDPEGKVLVPAGWVELKGWRHKEGHLPGKAQEKADALAGIVDEAVTILVGSDPDWRWIRHLWKPRIPEWETPRQNLRTDPEVFTR